MVVQLCRAGRVDGSHQPSMNRVLRYALRTDSPAPASQQREDHTHVAPRAGGGRPSGRARELLRCRDVGLGQVRLTNKVAAVVAIPVNPDEQRRMQSRQAAACT
jgi:hypothetical protein